MVHMYVVRSLLDDDSDEALLNPTELPPQNYSGLHLTGCMPARNLSQQSENLSQQTVFRHPLP